MPFSRRLLSPVALAALVPLNARALDEATVMSQELYCSVYNLISSDLGLFIGLGLAFFGFVQILTSGLKFGRVMLLAGGILITALPGIFESLVAGTGTTLQPLGANDLYTLGHSASGAGVAFCDEGVAVGDAP